MQTNLHLLANLQCYLYTINLLKVSINMLHYNLLLMNPILEEIQKHNIP